MLVLQSSIWNCRCAKVSRKIIHFYQEFHIHEPRHDKTNKMSVRPAKTQISLGIRPVWSESSLSAWRNLGSLASHWAHSEDSDQTGRMPRLIWVFAGRTHILLGLSCRGSYLFEVSVLSSHMHTLFQLLSVCGSDKYFCPTFNFSHWFCADRKILCVQNNYVYRITTSLGVKIGALKKKTF